MKNEQASMRKLHDIVSKVKQLKYFNTLEFIVEANAKPLEEIMKPLLESRIKITENEMMLIHVAINTILDGNFQGKELLQNLRSTLDTCYPENNSRRFQGNQFYINHDAIAVSNSTNYCKWATLFAAGTLALGVSYMSIQNEQINIFKP